MARRLPPKPGRGRGPARAAAPPGRRPRPAAGRPAPRPDAAGSAKPEPKSRYKDKSTPKPRHASAAAPGAAAGAEPHGPERLQKVLAAAGFGSRRACEDLIVQGRVAVNDTVITELGTKVEPDARIDVDGQRIHREKLVYLLVHKPRGYVSSNTDPSGKPLVIDLVAGVPQRVYTVGRLDEDSTGLMILTNDGELANKLAHPRYGVEKVYKAVVAGHPSPEVIAKLMEGVWLSDGKARARRVRIVGQQGDATQVEMVLAEGKNREVRRMWAKLGHKVMRLNRVAIGPLTIKGLKLGSWRNLTTEEVDELRQVAAGKKVPTAWFDERDPVRRETRPRRGPGRHEYEAAARKPRLSVAETGDEFEAPPRPLGPRVARPGAPPKPGGTRPLGPRAERAGGPPRPGGPKRPAGPGAGAERPAGPRASAPPGPGGERPAGPRGGARPGPGPGPGARRPVGPRGPQGPGPRPQGPAAGRPPAPRDAGLTGRPVKRSSSRDADSLEIDIEIPPAYAALPPSKRPPAGPKGPRAARPGPGPARPRPAPELGGRKVIGLEPEGEGAPPSAAPRRPRPAPKRARPLAKPRREKPTEPEDGGS